jgi:glycosyltransferase involved in cell wall biosynthesis
MLVPPADAEALATALVRAVLDSSERETLGAHALAASRRYDIRECVAQMQDLYDEILAPSRPSHAGAA